jgi:hypothetical protein
VIEIGGPEGSEAPAEKKFFYFLDWATKND